MRRRVLVRLACVLVAVSGPARGADWVPDASGSELAFAASFEGAPAPGQFRKFAAAVRFESDRPVDGRIDVTIDVRSADMGSEEINRAIRGSDWFDSDRFPVAEFRAASVRGAGAAGFVATGTLKVKGTVRSIDVPFTWQATAGGATMAGDVTIDRAAYGIGLGEWLSTKAIGPEVKVRFTLRLHRVP